MLVKMYMGMGEHAIIQTIEECPVQRTTSSDSQIKFNNRIDISAAGMGAHRPPKKLKYRDFRFPSVRCVDAKQDRYSRFNNRIDICVFTC